MGEARSRVIPANEYQRVRWKNGLGWTREITRGYARPAQKPAHPGADFPSSDDWDWRLSIAEIERDAAFSSFPGIDRELVLLRGNGLRLRFGDGRTVDLMPPHDRYRFAGEDGVTGELVDGTTHDFNLMWRRGRVRTELLHRPLVGPMLFFTEPGVHWVVHLIAGQAAFDGASGLDGLCSGDTAVLTGDDTRTRHALHGGGELLAIRIEAEGR